MSERFHPAPDYRAEGRAVSSAADADLAAFVLDNYPRLIRLAALVLRDIGDAEDAVQAALERAWKSRSSLIDASRTRAWLDRIVVREAIRADRRRQGFLAWLRIRRAEDEDISGAHTASPDVLAALRSGLAKLSAKHRAVVVVHLYAGYSVAETAALLEVPLDTVRSRLRAARAHLRRELVEVEP